MGIAALSTLVSVRERFHSARIGESVSLYTSSTQERLLQAGARLGANAGDAHSGSLQAVATLAGIVRRQGFTMAFSDTLLVLSCVLLSSSIALLFMRKPHVSGGGAAH